MPTSCLILLQPLQQLVQKGKYTVPVGQAAQAVLCILTHQQLDRTGELQDPCVNLHRVFNKTRSSLRTRMLSALFNAVSCV